MIRMGAFPLLNLSLLLILGGAVLIALRILHRPGRKFSSIESGMNITGWLLVLQGFVGVTLTCFTPFAMLAWLLTPFLLFVFFRHYMLEKRALLWTVAISAERGAPLDQAIDAFAAERYDRLGDRAMHVAERLRAGERLPAAFKTAGVRLRSDAMLAIGIGEATGDIGGSLRTLLENQRQEGAPLRKVVERMLYLIWLSIFLFFILLFLCRKVIPVFARIFEDFGMELPRITLIAIGAANTVLFWLPLLGCMAPLGILLLLAVFGATPLWAPIFGRMSSRRESGVLMRGLACAMRCGFPLTRALELLAATHPRWMIQQRLQRAHARVVQGESWITSMRETRLLSVTDAAVLAPAERAGNLIWALEEMADRQVRINVQWLQFFANTLFPIVLGLIGGVVAIFVIGLFLPLVGLINGLT